MHNSKFFPVLFTPNTTQQQVETDVFFHCYLTNVPSEYDPEYIKFGYIMAVSDVELKAQCIKCGAILSQFQVDKLLFFFNSHFLGGWSLEMF